MSLIKAISTLFKGPEPVADLGRNETCWCGSGKKYKRCHLDKDRLKGQSRGGNCTTS